MYVAFVQSILSGILCTHTYIHTYIHIYIHTYERTNKRTKINRGNPAVHGHVGEEERRLEEGEDEAGERGERALVEQPAGGGEEAEAAGADEAEDGVDGCFFVCVCVLCGSDGLGFVFWVWRGV